MSEQIILNAIEALVCIKEFVSENPNSKFYIGKTDDYARREQEHLSHGYSGFKVISQTSSIEELNKLERLLIMISRVFYKENLENENNGGGGNISESSDYYIYITSK